MIAGKSFFFSKIGVQSCVRFRCTLLHSYFALHKIDLLPFKRLLSRLHFLKIQKVVY